LGKSAVLERAFDPTFPIYYGKGHFTAVRVSQRCQSAAQPPQHTSHHSTTLRLGDKYYGYRGRAAWPSEIATSCVRVAHRFCSLHAARSAPQPMEPIT